MCWPTQSSAARIKKVTGSNGLAPTLNDPCLTSASLGEASTHFSRRQMIELAILRAQIGEVRFSAQAALINLEGIEVTLERWCRPPRTPAESRRRGCPGPGRRTHCRGARQSNLFGAIEDRPLMVTDLLRPPCPSLSPVAMDEMF